MQQAHPSKRRRITANDLDIDPHITLQRLETFKVKFQKFGRGTTFEDLKPIMKELFPSVNFKSMKNFYERIGIPMTEHVNIKRGRVKNFLSQKIQERIDELKTLPHISHQLRSDTSHTKSRSSSSRSSQSSISSSSRSSQSSISWEWGEKNAPLSLLRMKGSKPEYK
jgi:hypothetical protein